MYSIENTLNTYTCRPFAEGDIQPIERKSSRENDMRKIIEAQLEFGQVDIDKIKIDLRCRDEIPQLLSGLQYIYRDKPLREKIFHHLKTIIPDNINSNTGRPGMELWKILVLGTLRLNCNWNYDKVHDCANNHQTVREFLGHRKDAIDPTYYKLQTIKDNVSLLTPKVLDHINQLVVAKGHQLSGGKNPLKLKGRCDSFVVETNVHYPTDINLLWDAMRKIVVLTAKECDQLGISEWRQYQHILRKIKKWFNQARRSYRGQHKEQLRITTHMAYLAVATEYIERARQTIAILQSIGMGQIATFMAIEYFIGHGQRQMDQIRRRVIHGETIAHSEKVFSLFEPHTEWISKGKAGVAQELGLKVCVLEDQFGYILHHHVMENQTDNQVAVSMVATAKKKFDALANCSFDKGFHSPDNHEKLGKLLDHQVVLPRKGKLSAKVREIETSEYFIKARRQHAAVESAINALENHGLDRCPDHGITGFKRYVALAVLARNIQILGATVRKKALKSLKRKKQAPDRDWFRSAA
jgi:hypothetical protein